MEQKYPEKKFVLKEDHLEVVVNHDDMIFLPDSSGEKINIGTYTQVTTQMIPKQNVEILRDFVVGEKEKADAQLVTLNKQLEELKDVDMIDLEVVEECKKVIGKGSKAFKTKMQVLNLHLTQIQKKNQLTKQIAYLENQLVQINKEHDDLNTALN